MEFTAYWDNLVPEGALTWLLSLYDAYRYFAGHALLMTSQRRSRTEYLLPKYNIMALDWYFNLMKRSIPFGVQCNNDFLITWYWLNYFWATLWCTVRKPAIHRLMHKLLQHQPRLSVNYIESAVKMQDHISFTAKVQVLPGGSTQCNQGGSIHYTVPLCRTERNLTAYQYSSVHPRNAACIG